MSTKLSVLCLGLLLGAPLLGSCGGDAAHNHDDELVVGVLLPFTGTSSATGSNFERAVLYAADRINEAGGIDGKNLHVLSRDTHSEVGRSERAIGELVRAGAKVIIGPESADIAAQLAPQLVNQDVVFMSPLVGSAEDVDRDCEHPWFRLAPSAKTLGESLAKLLDSEGAKKVAVVYASDAYNAALHDALKARWAQLSDGDETLDLMIDERARSYASTINAIEREQVDAVVLATSPRAGALVLNEFDAKNLKGVSFFLSPLLKTELFVQNVAPSVVEGALGVAPRVFDESQGFPSAFSERWRGDQPLEGAYFYYDAMALVALALERASRDEALSLEQAILQLAAPPGQEVRWNELERGLSKLRQGSRVYYSGLTGPMLLERCGARKLGISTVWTVRSGTIQNRSE